MGRFIQSTFIFAAFLAGCEGEQRHVTAYGTLEGPYPVRQPESADAHSTPMAGDRVFETAREIDFDRSPTRGVHASSPRDDRQVGWDHVPSTVAPQVARMVVGDENIIGVHCTDQDCLAVSSTGGLFRTDAFGEWQPQDTILPALRKVYFDRTQVFACPEDGRFGWYSEDRGRHWVVLDFPCGAADEPSFLAGEFSIVVRGSQFRYGSLRGGQYRWLPLPVDSIQAVYSDWARLLFFTPHGLVRSRDGGRQFFVHDQGFDLEITRAVVGDDKGMIVAVGDATAGAPVTISTDGGESWVQPDDWPSNIHALHHVYLGADRRIVVVNEEQDHLPLQSLDQGKTWSVIRTQLTALGPVSGSHGHLVFATDRGVGFSPNNEAVYPLRLNQPLFEPAFIQPRIALAPGVYGGILRTDDGGITWYTVPRTHGLVFDAVVHLGQERLVAWSANGLFRSLDGGEQWSSINSPEGCEAETVLGRDTVLLIDCRDGRLAQSVDSGESWSQTHEHSLDLTNMVWFGNGHRLIATTPDGLELYRSDNLGGDWAPLSVPVDEGILELRSIDRGASILTTRGRIIWTDDEGQTWSPLNTHEPSIPDARRHYPLTNERWLVLEDGGVWVLNPSGAIQRLTIEPFVLNVATRGDGGVVLNTPTSTVLMTPVSEP